MSHGVALVPACFFYAAADGGALVMLLSPEPPTNGSARHTQAFMGPAGRRREMAPLAYVYVAAAAHGTATLWYGAQTLFNRRPLLHSILASAPQR